MDKQIDFRIIPVKRREPNNYDSEETFVVPVKVLKILKEKASGPVVPIVIERLDFFTGELKRTLAITFKKSLGYFEDFEKKIPFNTDGIVYKEEGKIRFKIIGAYNTGFVETYYDVQYHILNNDESQMNNIYESNYQEIREWIGNINSNDLDLKK